MNYSIIFTEISFSPETSNLSVNSLIDKLDFFMINFFMNDPIFSNKVEMNLCTCMIEI